MGAAHLKYFERPLHEVRRSSILHYRAVSADPAGVSWCRGLHPTIKDSTARRYYERLRLGIFAAQAHDNSLHAFLANLLPHIIRPLDFEKGLRYIFVRVH